jgi:glycogen debranching enzyme
MSAFAGRESFFDPAPARLTESLATFRTTLEAGHEASYRCAIACEVDGDSPIEIHPSYEKVVQEAATAVERERAQEAQIFTANEQFNDWLNRSLADLYMMRTQTAFGPYPYAGVPWFSTVFGRDGIVTAFQCLSFDPSIARGVLGYLAAAQADSESPEQDAQPGKVLHEMRADEMATLGEVLFKRYYGTIDATPLFVMLAGAYYQRTGDRPFIDSIWSNVERALNWIDRYGDSDGDGFVEYARKSKHEVFAQLGDLRREQIFNRYESRRRARRSSAHATRRSDVGVNMLRRDGVLEVVVLK